MVARKKILFIMQLPPPVHGVSVMNAIIEQSKLINSTLHCDYINLATTRNINDLRKSRFYKYITTLKIVFRVIKKLLTERYDYVYITIFPFGFAFYKDSIMVLLARLFKQTPLLHLHTHGFRKASQQSKLTKWYYKFVFKKAEVICLSDLLLEDIELFYQGKVYILPNGIPQVNFSNTYHAKQQTLTLLYLSNLIKGKGIMLIMEAARLLKERGCAFALRVAGPEGDVGYSELEAFVKQNGLTNEVSLLGPKYGNEKHEEFKRADIFLLPSNYDTFGLVLLEAMQFGVPCIASNIGGIPDVIGNGRGVLLETLSPKALADKIEFLLNNPEERLTVSNLAFNYFKTNFTVNVFEQRLLKILCAEPEKINTTLIKHTV